MENGPNITGSGPDYHKKMDSGEYARKINTPARNLEYFRLFHQPIIERAKTEFGVPIHVLDIACGPAYELDFIKDDPDVKIIATDISSAILVSVKEKLGKDAVVFASDVNLPATKENIAEVGILVNATGYIPHKMLENMYHALKPGGCCSVNFKIFGNQENKAFYEIAQKHGGKILDRELKVQTKDREKIFNVKVLDNTETINKDGSPDLAIRQLGQQIYFRSAEDVMELIKITGFEQIEHSQFDVISPSGDYNNQFDVFTLRKPL